MTRRMSGLGVLMAAGWTLAQPVRAGVTVQTAAAEATMGEETGQVFTMIAQPLQARAGVTTAPLLSAEKAALLGRRLRGDAGLRVYLVIDRLQVRSDPGALLRLELAVSTPRQRRAPAPEAVGDFNLFGVAHAEGATAQRSFEVTHLLRRLAPAGAVSLRVVAGADAAADTHVEIGKVSLLLRPGGAAP